MAVRLVYVWVLLTLVSAQMPNSYSNAQFDLYPACGDEVGAVINITYSGTATAIYSASNSSCTFTETEPTIWTFTDMNTACGLHTAGSTSLLYVDIVIQQNHVRQLADPVYTISCNYGLGKDGQGGQNPMTFEKIQKVPKVTAVEGDSTGNTSLVVQDVRGREVTQVLLGQYIRLVSTLTPGPDENGLRVWNCKAIAHEQSVPFWFLISGCGEGTIISQKKGFVTTSLTSVGPYFRAFSLPGENSVVFGCTYIVCSGGSNACEGDSCSASSRKRRALTVDELIKSPKYPAVLTLPHGIRAPVGSDGLPVVYSTYITVVRRQDNNKNVKLSPGDLVTGDDPDVVEIDTPASPINNIYVFISLGLLLLVIVIIIATAVFFRRLKSTRPHSEADSQLKFQTAL